MTDSFARRHACANLSGALLLPGRTAPVRISPAWCAAGVLLLVLAWHLAARQLGPQVLATPWQALRAIGPLLHSPQFYANAGVCLMRIGAGVLAGASVGFALGMLAGHSGWLRGLIEPLRWLLTALPPVVAVVPAALWFGRGSPMVIVITALIMAPGMYSHTVQGVQAVDCKLVEMTRVYRYGMWRSLRHLYLPVLRPVLLAALIGAASTGARLVVMAEALGAESGVGHALANARGAFASAELIAWALLILGLAAALEFACLRPLRRRLEPLLEQPRHA